MTGSAEIFRPLIFNIRNNDGRTAYQQLIDSGQVIVYDEIDGQIRELIKSYNPSIKIKSEEYPALVNKHLDGCAPEDYGVWVYYPWSNSMVHLLDEEEFVEVRTNRNRYKITREEQKELKGKKIGIVGLSVGQSIALTIAMERICGELRLADFDTAELSNLNRIRTGVHNLGVRKTIIAAREIAEIDPFLKVRIFNDGLTDGNIDEFFTGDGKLDLLVEVCDGLDIKIISRFKARSLRIPVVMDTNDRGMLDVERFDLEPERPILHGLAGDLDPLKIKDLTNEEKIPYILKMVGADTISTRLKASMMEVEQSVNTWPQLASSVVLGGALVTDTSRRILLDQYHDSGRYYIDFDELIAEKQAPDTSTEKSKNPHTPLGKGDMEKVADQFFKSNHANGYLLNDDLLSGLIDAARAAPSAGNNQPWMWLYKKGVLFLFHDKFRTWSWGDYYEMGAHMALGAALENVHLQAAKDNIKDTVTLFPIKGEPSLIAAIYFEELKTPVDAETLMLAEKLFQRSTNRKLSPRQPLPAGFGGHIQTIANSIDNVELFYTDNEAQLAELGEIMGACDRIRLLYQQGHEEFYNEVRWNAAHAAATRDGIELAAVDLTQGEIAGFTMAKDWNAIALLSDWQKGNAFKRLSAKTMKMASSAALFTVPFFDHASLINGGRAVQRSWIFANKEGVSVHPMLSPIFFFNRLFHGAGAEMNEQTITELKELWARFVKIFPVSENSIHQYSCIFLMKFAIADDIGVKSLRRNKEEIFFSA
ncbi:MAG: Rv1355c family protein [Taibaiella sp.]|nr:Rv1355c family protein [Taibaiella sp.]